MATLESVISQYREGFNQYKSQRDELQDERNSLWGKDIELSHEIDGLQTEVVNAEKSLDHATPGDIRRGLDSVKIICSELGISGGVFGPIIELLHCDEKFFTAVEVTAGNRLLQNLLWQCLKSGYVGNECLCCLQLVKYADLSVLEIVSSLSFYFYSLFHVVVETDEISTQIIRHLNALKGGRVTFIPLKSTEL
ncbi:hypothetical protein U1Q18_047585 [Sarracenia purpurea var. burkii]